MSSVITIPVDPACRNRGIKIKSAKERHLSWIQNQSNVIISGGALLAVAEAGAVDVDACADKEEDDSTKAIWSNPFHNRGWD